MDAKLGASRIKKERTGHKISRFGQGRSFAWIRVVSQKGVGLGGIGAGLKKRRKEGKGIVSGGRKKKKTYGKRKRGNLVALERKKQKKKKKKKTGVRERPSNSKGGEKTVTALR